MTCCAPINIAILLGKSVLNFSPCTYGAFAMAGTSDSAIASRNFSGTSTVLFAVDVMFFFFFYLSLSYLPLLLRFVGCLDSVYFFTLFAVSV